MVCHGETGTGAGGTGRTNGRARPGGLAPSGAARVAVAAPGVRGLPPEGASRWHAAFVPFPGSNDRADAHSTIATSAS